MSARLLLLSCALLVAGAPPAYADGNGPRARALTREALELYRAGKYDQAIPRFEQAYALSSAPLLLYDIAQAYRLSGDCAQAQRYYADYLRRVPAARNRASVESKRAAMDGCAAQAHRSAPPPQPAATSEPAAVAPSAASSTAPPEAHPRAADLAPSPPPLPVAAIDPAPSPTLVAAPARRSPRRPKLIAGATLAAAGLALIGTAVYFSVDAADRSQQVSHFFADGGRWNDQLQSIESSGRTDTAASAALYSVGGALGVAGTSLLILSWKRERR